MPTSSSLRTPLLLCLLAALMFPRVVVALAPFQPGREQDVEKLIAGPPDLGKYSLHGARITAFAIEIRLLGSGGESVVELHPQDETGIGRKIGTTKSFSLWLDGPQDPALDAAAQKLLERIASRDDGRFYEGRATTPAQPQVQPNLLQARSLGIPDAVRRALTWAALLVLLGWILASALRKSGRAPADLVWMMFLLVAAGVAVVLRFKLPPGAPLHTNMHGIAELRGLASPEGTWHGPVETDTYGYAYRQVVRAVIGLWHGQVRSALGFAAVAGGLSVIPMSLLAASLFKSRWAGVLAGLALALYPAHILLSLSESPMPLAGLLFLTALACCAALGSAEAAQQRRLAWAAALAAACSAELSLQTLFLVAGLVLAVLIWRTARIVPSLRPFAWPSVVLLVTFALHVYATWPVLISKDVARRSGSTFLKSLVDFFANQGKNLMRDGTLVPPPFLVIAALGLLGLLVRRRFALTASTLLLIAVPLIPAVAVTACRSDLIRYQTVPQLGIVLFMAAAVLTLSEQLESKTQASTALVLSLVIILPVRKQHTKLREQSLDTAGFLLAESALEHLPDDATVRIAPRRDGEVLNDFPDYLAQAHGHRVRVDDDGSMKGSCYVWLGPACYAFTKEEVEQSMPAQAQRVGSAPLRRECYDLIEQLDAAAPPVVAEVVPIPWRDREFFEYPNQDVLVGMFPCAARQKTAPAPATTAVAPGSTPAPATKPH